MRLCVCIYKGFTRKQIHTHSYELLMRRAEGRNCLRRYGWVFRNSSSEWCSIRGRVVRRSIPAFRLGRETGRAAYRDPGEGCPTQAVTFLEGCGQLAALRNQRNELPTDCTSVLQSISFQHLQTSNLTGSPLKRSLQDSPSCPSRALIRDGKEGERIWGGNEGEWRLPSAMWYFACGT